MGRQEDLEQHVIHSYLDIVLAFGVWLSFYGHFSCLVAEINDY